MRPRDRLVAMTSDTLDAARPHRGAENREIHRMRALRFVLALSITALLAAPVVAQEGHPLKGSWIGTWTTNHNQGNDLLLVLNWDGKNITGTINPGTDNIADQERHAAAGRLGRPVRGRGQGQGRQADHLRARGQDRQSAPAQPHDHRHLEESGRERRLQALEAIGVRCDAIARAGWRRSRSCSWRARA